LGSLMVCPRCGLPVKAVYAYEKGSNVYYYAYHGNGRKCYLGPYDYVYATTTHEYIVRGAVDVDRELRYLGDVVAALTKAASLGRLGGRDAVKAVTEALDAIKDLAMILMESGDERVREEVRSAVLNRIEALRRAVTE